MYPVPTCGGKVDTKLTGSVVVDRYFIDLMGLHDINIDFKTRV